MAATSDSPRAEPCASPVFCLFGAGQPMIVDSAMIDGALGVVPAVISARYSASVSSW